ncbi:MAG: AAA family ATPase [Desulfobacterales bacterium]|jgi:uncharacterized protein YhaN
MRIDRLDLIAYGSFSNTSLDLSDGSAGLHLIYGDNEAGKSTSLRALTAWLFGIPVRTNDNYLHPNPQLRIGGKLRLSGGEKIEFIRRKGKKGTLLSPNMDAVYDDSILSPFLSVGIDENLFTKLYGIDHDRLVAGGQELLDQSGDLGQALFSAAIGTAGLREILSDLRNGAEALFKPRATKKRVNRAIFGFKEAQKRIKDSILPVAQWKRLQKELAESLAAIERVETKLNEKSREKSRLNRLNRVNGVLAERRAIIAQIDAMGNILLLPQDFDDQRKTAIGRLQAACERKQRAEAKRSRLTDESESIDVRTELLDNEDTILSIYKELGAVETAIKDRPSQDGKRRLLRNEAEQLLKGVRPDIDLDSAEQLRPLTNNEKWIFGLVRKHGLLDQRREKAASTLRDITDEQEIIERKLNQQEPSNLDLGELKAAVTVARKSGNLEQRLAESQKRASDGKAACQSELSRLGRFSGTIEVLLNIAMPLPETLDRFERRFDDLSEKIKDYRRRQQEIKIDRIQTEQDLNALLLTGNVPVISELEQARLERDTGWRLIKQKYIKQKKVNNEIAEFAANSDLPSFYEQKVEVADQVADKLRSAADQVVKRADLEARIKQLTSDRKELTMAAEQANSEREAQQEKWHSIWKPLDIAPGSPREMKQWLLRVDKLLTNLQVATTVADDAKRLAENCKLLKESVSRQILKFDRSIDLKEMSLEAMINLCEQRIDREENRLERKRRWEHTLDDIKIRIKRIREELAAIEDDQAGWAREWRQAVDGLGLKANVHPEQATEAFNQLLVFFEKFNQSEELRRRIYGIDQVSEKFEQRVFEVADSIGFKREGQGSLVIAAQLHRDLNEAREQRASLKKINAQEKELAEEIEDADITIRAAQQQLDLLKKQAQVETDDELESAGTNSRKLRELQQKLDLLERELTRNGGGLGIEELEKEAAGSDIDAIEGDLDRVTAELEELQAKRDTLRDQRQAIHTEIKAKDGSAKAANASVEAELQLAAIVSGAEQYLRLQIAALILEQRIEDYRKKNQAPVLARAGQLFARLTLGSYTSLRDELDESGKPILLGVRPNNAVVSVDGMSDGTRDQLYLSLRLATLEQHLSQGEPMPFVVDDILIGFDDHRTRVCLEVLADLAARTQVLLFTHHRRVLELAGKIEADAGIYTHELR